jgi:hypothetical protein
MIVQFSIKNFKTFKDKATLSFVASNYDKDTREDENIFQDTYQNLRLLKSAVIYGANASGKSKFIEALVFMKRFVITSSKDSQKGDKISVEPFKLNSVSEKEPSEFEVIFTHKNILYRYGFEVTNKIVISEWLYSKPKTKEIELFYRDYQNFETHKRSFQKGNTLVKEGLIRDNALFLSVAAQFNEKSAVNIIEWFKNIGTISGIKEEGYEGYTINKAKDSNFKNRILELLKAADLGIQDIQVEMLDLEKLPHDMPKELKEFIIKKSEEDEDAEFLSDVLTTHKKYDGHNNLVGKVNLSLNDDESFGTRKFFALTGPVLDSLENGHTLVIDELDTKLHPNLVCKIVSLFNSKEKNPKNAQLLFNTHDTNLLSSRLFRRDQVWFTEKNKFGEGKLYSLADFKSEDVRKNDPFEDNYIRGKYGAVPYLGYFDNLIPQS